MDLSPLLSRIAVVDSDADDGPKVKFFTCGTRAHPSAPLTGLAVLSFASRVFDWLPSSLESIETPRGRVRVPRVRETRDGRAEVEFPEVLVTFAASSDSSSLGA
jgi:hypothetical protein